MSKNKEKNKTEESYSDVVMDGHFKIEEPKSKEVKISGIEFLASKGLYNSTNELFINKKYPNSLMTEKEWDNLLKKDKLIK